MGKIQPIPTALTLYMSGLDLACSNEEFDRIEEFARDRGWIQDEGDDQHYTHTGNKVRRQLKGHLDNAS